MIATIICLFLLGAVLDSAGVTLQQKPYHCLAAIGVLLLHAFLLFPVTM